MKYKICLAVLASILALAASGCSSSQDEGQPNMPQQQQSETKTAPPISAESERFCQEGLAAYSRFEYDAAIAAYDKAIQTDGRNYQALSGKGVALAMRGNETGSRQDVADGIASIQKALALQPDYVPAFYDLALAYKIDGQYDKSISYFQKVLAADPNNTWSYYGIATIYGDKGDAKNAVAYLKKAAALDKENVLEAARTQSHFDSIRNDAEFRALVSP